MQTNLFTSVFATTTTTTTDASALTGATFLLCMVTALFLGVVMAKMYAYHTRYSSGFLATLALIPVVVAMVIMMVNGNIGAGVAVVGAFSLIRFRSIPGTATEIGAIFTAMCTGLTIGMGYIGFAVVFAAIACTFAFVLKLLHFGEHVETGRVLQITIPESLNYTEAFDDIFAEYTASITPISAKTTNMGSMFKLSYEMVLKPDQNEKAFMDALRCRNGNLEIRIAKKDFASSGL